MSNEITAFLANKENDWSPAAKLLLEEQKKNWSLLSNNYKSLSTIEVKEFEFNNFKLRVQFNPGRITSTSADVSETSIENRKCFLCKENLPPEQRGILYKNNFIILVNPFPIFPEHFTIAKTGHVPQEIINSFEDLLSLSKDLSKDYIVFYNGPKCGASAPDHLHFQAGNKFFMPIDFDYKNLKDKSGEIIFYNEDINIFGIDDGLRRFISFESSDQEAITKLFGIFYSSYKYISDSSEEPKLNILSSYEKDTGWRIIFFLREKHRPSHFFAGEKDKILLSPAAVDYGGVCITPLKKDFERITKNILIEIFHEVSFDKNNFRYLAKVLEEKIKQI